MTDHGRENFGEMHIDLEITSSKLTDEDLNELI
jgi:hypothetical protein